MGNILAFSNGDHQIQVFPLKKGGVNLTSTDGEILNVSLVHCVVGGTITITWSDTTTDNIDCTEGNDFSIVGAKSVTITAGTFHLT